MGPGKGPDGAECADLVAPMHEHEIWDIQPTIFSVIIVCQKQGNVY